MRTWRIHSMTSAFFLDRNEIPIMNWLPSLADEGVCSGGCLLHCQGYIISPNKVAFLPHLLSSSAFRVLRSNCVECQHGCLRYSGIGRHHALSEENTSASTLEVTRHASSGSIRASLPLASCTILTIILCIFFSLCFSSISNRASSFFVISWRTQYGCLLPPTIMSGLMSEIPYVATIQSTPSRRSCALQEKKKLTWSS
jgi:hypothetical protein